MGKALTITRARLAAGLDPHDAVRKALVLFCGGALAAAGPLLPTLA